MYLDIVATLFKTCALTSLDEDCNGARRFLHYFYRFLMIFSLFFILASYLYELLLLDEFSILKESMNILNFAIYTSVIIRLCYFMKYDEQSSSLINKMRVIFRQTSNCGVGQEKTITGVERVVKKLSIFLVIYDMGSLLFLPITAIVNLFLIGKTNPFGGAFPYDWKKPIFYEITFILQTIAACASGAAGFCADLFYIASILHLSEQFKLIAWEAKHILYTSLIKIGVRQEDVLKFKELLDAEEDPAGHRDFRRVKRIIESPEFQVCLRNYLRTCVKRHILLLKYFDELVAFIAPILLVLLGFETFFLPIEIFTIMKTDDFNVYVVMVSYLFFTLLCVFSYSLFPQILTNEAENYMKSLCEYQWYYCTDRIANQNYLFMIVKAQNLVVVKAGYFIDMGISVFVVVLKSSVSYLGLLRQMGEN